MIILITVMIIVIIVMTYFASLHTDCQKLVRAEFSKTIMSYGDVPITMKYFAFFLFIFFLVLCNIKGPI